MTRPSAARTFRTQLHPSPSIGTRYHWPDRSAMPSGNRVSWPERRPGTSRVTQRLGIRPRPNTAAHRREKRRAVASPRPPAYMARSPSALNGRVLIVISQVVQLGWMRRPVIRVGVMRMYTSRAPAAHGSRCVRFCSCSISRSPVTLRARPCTRTLQPVRSASLRQSASKLTWPLAWRARSVSGAVRKMMVFAVTAKLTGSIIIPSAAVNPTRPIPPGSSRSKHSAGLSIRRACPFPVVMDVHLRHRRLYRSPSLPLARHRALRPDVPRGRDVRPQGDVVGPFFRLPGVAGPGAPATWPLGGIDAAAGDAVRNDPQEQFPLPGGPRLNSGLFGGPTLGLGFHVVRGPLDQHAPALPSGDVDLVDLERDRVVPARDPGLQVLVERAVPGSPEHDRAVVPLVVHRQHGRAEPAGVGDAADSARRYQPQALGLVQLLDDAVSHAWSFPGAALSPTLASCAA